MSFASLKKNSANSVEKLTAALEKLNNTNTKSGDDDRFWKPELDKAGNGLAIIRFLPASEADGEDALPWVRLFDHGFKGPGGWYIENSLTTLNQKDPVSEYNSVLWNSGVEANKEIARKQKRRLKYIANILVISDPKHPENEGKVFLFKFGKKIFDKITEAMHPQFEDEKAYNPFDFWAGANFKLKIRNYEGYPNYDKSEFESPSALFGGDDKKLEAVYKQEHSLKAFLDPSNFKSYDELKRQLDKALGNDGAAPAPATKAETAAPSAPAKTRPVAKAQVSDSDDEDMDYFKSLANDE